MVDLSTRQAAAWRGVSPGLWIERAGGMAALGLRCLLQLFSGGLSWRREFDIQFGNVFALAVIPVFVISLLVGCSGTDGTLTGCQPRWPPWRERGWGLPAP